MCHGLCRDSYSRISDHTVTLGTTKSKVFSLTKVGLRDSTRSGTQFDLTFLSSRPVFIYIVKTNKTKVGPSSRQEVAAGTFTKSRLIKENTRRTPHFRVGGGGGMQPRRVRLAHTRLHSAHWCARCVSRLTAARGANILGVYISNLACISRLPLPRGLPSPSRGTRAPWRRRAPLDQSFGLTRVACIARVNGSYPSPRSLP